VETSNLDNSLAEHRLLWSDQNGQRKSRKKRVLLSFNLLAGREDFPEEAKPRNTRNTRKSEPLACFLFAYSAYSAVSLPGPPVAALPGSAALRFLLSFVAQQFFYGYALFTPPPSSGGQTDKSSGVLKLS
jgi:hypothetical protein